MLYLYDLIEVKKAMKKIRVGSKVVVSLVKDATVYEVVEIVGFNVSLTYPILKDGEMVNTMTQWVDKSFIRKVIEY